MPEDEKASGTQDSSKKKPSGKTVAIIVIAVVAIVAAGAYWFVNYKVPHDNAVAAFNAAADSLNERNGELDSAISDLQDLMNSGDAPLDQSTIEAASVAIGTAQGAKQSVPEMQGIPTQSMPKLLQWGAWGSIPPSLTTSTLQRPIYRAAFRR